MWYVGLDVHRDTVAVSVRGPRGLVVKREVVATTRSALRRALRGIRGRVRIVCESGPLAGWVKESLETGLREVVVCDRRRARLSTSGAKTDRIDADKLSELLRSNSLHPVYVAQGDHLVLRRLAGHYIKMLMERSRVIQRLRSLFLESGIRVNTPRSAPERVPLRRLRDDGSKAVARAYLQQLKISTELVADARELLIEHARRFEAFDLLQTIPYVGEIRAAELLAVVGHPARFGSLRRFWAYGGLGVVQRTSAEHRLENGRVVREERVHRIRLSRAAQPVLKKLLRDIALFASVGRGTFRSVYDSHIGRGKQPAIARVALARKIAAIILAVWRTGMPFSASLVYTNAKDSGRASEEEFGPERTRAAKAVDLTICRPELTSTGHRRPN